MAPSVESNTAETLKPVAHGDLNPSPQPSTPSQDASSKPKNARLPRMQTPKAPSGASDPVTASPTGASAAKRGGSVAARKHQHTVSFGSPLVEAIDTPTKVSPGTSTRGSRGHRRQSSSTSSSVSGAPPSAAQLALIQQRYVDDQHTALQQRILQEQLAKSPASIFGRRGGGRVTGGSGMAESMAAGGSVRGPTMAGGLVSNGLTVNRPLFPVPETESVTDHSNANVQARGLPSSLPVPPTTTVRNASTLDPNDIQQTNNALAQQLALLTLMHEYRKNGQLAGLDPGAIAQAAHGMTSAQQQAPPPGLGYASNGGVGLGLGMGMPTNANGNPGIAASFVNTEKPSTSSAAAASTGTGLGPRADPLYNPTNTTNVYINNLPTAFTESHLYKLCQSFGSIVSVRMMLRETGTCYGFVLFENVESAESCIMWLRQFSDVHPSFARTPLKNPNRPAQAQENTQLNSLPTLSALNALNVQTPQKSQSLASPIRFTTANNSTFNGVDTNSVMTPPHPSLPPIPTAHYGSVSSTPNYAAVSTPVHNNTLPPPGLSSSAQKGDVRPMNGRVGSLGLQQLFPQRDPATINAVVSAASTTSAPFTPPPASVASQLNAGSGLTAPPGLPAVSPSLLVEGLPNNIDLLSLENLFAPHPIHSVRFFRMGAVNPSTGLAGGEVIRIAALFRLSSVAVAEECIAKLNGRSINGWTPPGVKLHVKYADADVQDQLTLSEKRLQSILSQQSQHQHGNQYHHDVNASPLERKSYPMNQHQHQQQQHLSSPLARFGPASPASSVSRYNNNHGADVNPLHILPPAPARGISHLNPNANSPRAPPSSYAIHNNLPHHQSFNEHRGPQGQVHGLNPAASILTDHAHAKLQSNVADSPVVQDGPSYKVPNNTPAKVFHSTTNGGSNGAHVVPLPTTYLQKRPDLTRVPSADGKEDVQEVGGDGAIPAPKFTMPSPSLFKAAPKSAPLRIRAPGGGEVLGSVKEEVEGAQARPSLPALSIPELQTPDMGESSKEHGDEHETSPTTTLGTLTPATLGGPFTPSRRIGEFSPEIAAHTHLHLHAHPGKGETHSPMSAPAAEGGNKLQVHMGPAAASIVGGVGKAYEVVVEDEQRADVEA